MVSKKSVGGALSVPSLKDLSDEELGNLYRLAPIKRLEANEVLIREGDTDRKFYVILTGEARVVKDLHGRAEILTNLPRDSWVGEIAFTRKIPRTVSVVTNKPSSVMVIEEATLKALNEKTQLFFFKRLNDLALDRISRLEAKEKALTRRNRDLMQNLFSLRSREKADYGSADLIMGIIKKIPRLPAFAGTLIGRLMQESFSIRDAANLVREDPSLVAAVLKMVNSPYYGFQKRITDINHAIVLIGFNELHRLVVGEGIRRTMPNTPAFHELQAHAVAISHIAFALSHEARVGKPAQLGTIGLLHDLGRSVLQLLKAQNSNLAFLIEGLDVAKLGALLLQSWNLPDLVWRCVRYQQYPEFSTPSRIPEDVRMPVVLLYLAHLCYGIFQGEREQDLSGPFLDDYLDLLKWGHFAPGRIVKEILVPNLAKKFETYPTFFRKLLSEQMKEKK